MKLNRLLKGIKAKVDPPFLEIDIKCVFTNSKTAKKGSLFVAIEGSRFDGHKFIEEAFEKGALASIVNKKKRISSKNGIIVKVKDTRKALSTVAKNFYNSPAKRLKVIGITGTNGKTTTAYLIESILNQAHIPCGIIGTIEYKIGKNHILAERTTPDALKTHELLSKMLKRRLKAVSMEVSSHALDQKRVDDVFFDAAIFTNLSHEHLDYHGDMTQYFASKAKIFKNIKKNGVAVINADDRSAKWIENIVSRKNIITYGLHRSADITARIKRVELSGSSFIVMVYGKEAFSVDTRLIGLYNIYNVLAAVATGVAEKIDFRDIKKGIERVHKINGRLEPIEIGQNFKVFVDYAHTHDALENVLKFLNHIKKRNIITVFGCGGDRDKEKRPLMGCIAQRLSDFVVITTDNPRNEKPKKIIKNIESGMNLKNKNYAVVTDRKKAIEKALKKAKINDIVLIAGKGHEKVQVIGDKEIPFDDKRVAEEILKSKIKMQKSK